jgi:hypothetical protein
VALGQVFLRVPRFPLSISFHRGSPYSYIAWLMNNRPAGGRSSEKHLTLSTRTTIARLCSVNGMAIRNGELGNVEGKS